MFDFCVGAGLIDCMSDTAGCVGAGCMSDTGGCVGHNY